MKTTTLNIGEEKIVATIREKITASIKPKRKELVFNNDVMSIKFHDSLAVIYIDNISNLVKMTEPFDTIEMFNLTQSEFVSTVNTYFEAHNKAVDLNFKKIKRSVIEKIKLFCGDFSKEQRKMAHSESFQKKIFEIVVAKEKIRFVPNQIFYFEHEVLTSTNPYTPLIFDITPKEFADLKKLYLDF